VQAGHGGGLEAALKTMWSLKTAPTLIADDGSRGAPAA
jgi:hypothetical protein